ncbi:MAG: AAA family ATPase [Prevotella sp.]|nr:AAA family ATPase [Prevotella sp.]
MEQKRRRLPLGIQSFEEIIKDGYLYVDKTDLVWKIANGGKFNYLSRPRRFGKSLLVDTLRCYFEGRKDLFEGLKIMELEKDWVQYPVIRLDMSCGGASEKSLRSYLDDAFSKYERTYDINKAPEASFATRFNNIIETACTKTGQPTVILIDEYDSPLQHSWHTPEHEICTAMYREVFSVLKAATQSEKFVFITGITKFTQISLFSVLNNLNNISFYPAEYAPVCGITVQETIDNFQPEIENMAKQNGLTFDGAVDLLKANYDGYHFSRKNMVDVFNPFSLINALAQGEVSNFWIASGATSMLPKFVDDMELRMKDFENTYILRNILESSDVTGGGAELFMYQSGYLTIKGCDESGYTLGFPNAEVRQALYHVVIPALTMSSQSIVVSAQAKLLRYMNNCMLPEAMQTLKALISDVPYSNKKLASMDMEERYRLIISSLFHAVGLGVEVERMMGNGRIDVIARTSRYTYVIELKLTKNGGLKAAEQQIKENQYIEPFKADGKQIVALAIELEDLGKGLLDWAVVNDSNN